MIPDLQDLLTRFDQREKRARPERFDLEEALATYDREASGIAPGAGWQLGAHRLFRGDATDAAFVARCLGGRPADLVFTDPPYNVAYGAHGGKAADRPARRLINDALPAEAWERFCRAWAASLTANVAGALDICMSSREWPVVCRVLAEVGAHWSDTIIWAKDRFTLGRADYQRQYEPIWYGWPDGSQRHWAGGRDQGDVWPIPRPAASPLHPTQKPLASGEPDGAGTSEPASVGEVGQPSTPASRSSAIRSAPSSRSAARISSECSPRSGARRIGTSLFDMRGAQPNNRTRDGSSVCCHADVGLPRRVAGPIRSSTQNIANRRRGANALGHCVSVVGPRGFEPRTDGLKAGLRRPVSSRRADT